MRSPPPSTPTPRPSAGVDEGMTEPSARPTALMWRVEHEAKVEAAVRAERERIFKNLCLSCRDGITLGPEIAAATRAGATAKEDRHD